MFKYDVFISFRHADARWEARKVRRWLQKFRLPKSISAKKTENLRIYVDTYQGRATSDYWEDNIKPALMESEYLIVIASPMANSLLSDGAPNWVMCEIAIFLKTPQRRNIIPIVTKKNKNRIIPNTLLQEFPKIQIIDLGSRDKFIPTIPFFENPSDLELMRVVIRVRGIDEANAEQLFNEEKRRTIWKLTATGIFTIIVLSAISASSILALMNGLGAAKLASNADITQAIERSLDKPDEAKLFAARALNTVNQSWMLAPFLIETRQYIRNILGIIQIPNSTIEWPGGRIDRLIISKDHSQVITLTENGYLAAYKSSDLTLIYKNRLSHPIFSLDIVNLDNGLVIHSAENIHQVTIINKEGKYIAEHTFNSSENIYLLSNGNLLYWSDSSQYPRLLNPISLQEISLLNKVIMESFKSARLAEKHNKLILNFRTNEDAICKVQIFDLITREIMDTPIEFVMKDCDLALDESEGFLFVSDIDGNIWRINLQNGQSDVSIPRSFDSKEVQNMWLSPDGKFALLERSDQIEIWNISAKKPNLLMPPIFPLGGYWTEPKFSESGDIVAIANKDGVRIINLNNPNEIKTVARENPSHALTWSIDDLKLVTADITGRVIVWDSSSGEVLFTGIKHHEGMVKLAFARDGLISGGWDGSIRLNKFESTMIPSTTVGIPDMSRSRGALGIDINSKNNLLAIGREDGKISVCSLHTGACNWSAQEPAAIRKVTFSSSGKLVMSDMAGTNQFRVRNVKDGLEVFSLTAATAISASPVADHLFILSTDNQARIIDFLTGKNICMIKELFHNVERISYSPNGKFVLIVNNSGEGTLLDAGLCRILWRRELGIIQPAVISFSHDSELFAVGGSNRGGVFKLLNGSSINLEFEDRHGINNIVFHPNKYIFLTTSYSRRLNLYDIENKVNMFSPVEFDAIPWSVSFDPSGNRFAVGFFANAQGRYIANIFDTSTGHTIGNPLSHSLDVYNIRFLESGSVLISSDGSGVVNFWNLGPDERSVDEILDDVGKKTGQTIDMESGAIHQLSIGGRLPDPVHVQKLESR